MKNNFIDKVDAWLEERHGGTEPMSLAIAQCIGWWETLKVDLVEFGENDQGLEAALTGILLAFVRESWGNKLISVLPKRGWRRGPPADPRIDLRGPVVTRGGAYYSGWQVWMDHERIGDGDTEIEALVAALLASPVKMETNNEN